MIENPPRTHKEPEPVEALVMIFGLAALAYAQTIDPRNI